jgi:hypothetical protein
MIENVYEHAQCTQRWLTNNGHECIAKLPELEPHWQDRMEKVEVMIEQTAGMKQRTRRTDY